MSLAELEVGWFWACSISGLSGGSERKGDKEDAAAGVLVPSSPESRHREVGVLSRVTTICMHTSDAQQLFGSDKHAAPRGRGMTH